MVTLKVQEALSMTLYIALNEHLQTWIYTQEKQDHDRLEKHIEPELADEIYKLVGDEDGVFGCMTLLGCEDVCPKELPLQSKIAYLRRKMLQIGLKND